MYTIQFDKNDPYQWLIHAGMTKTSCVVIKTVPVGDKTRGHTHEWEQAYIVLEGEQAVMKIDKEERVVVPGTVVWIPANAWHELANTGATPIRYIYVAFWPSQESHDRFMSEHKKLWTDWKQAHPELEIPERGEQS